ncbi:alpha/beta hydrolase [Elizabethkingia meningoseptica]|uniref:alpha/beta hydrolase n=1 Tax=Elizabethkingia meningoseptica TaxID=238 RepID=UPI0022F18B0B|nr:alpha/beta hydrolase [Elizabethkingia meningoseptica]EJK5328129.1 alpha/beta hydrolase [Elizabethkingia meningoseptica]WBS74107.1 alpha/beta hydrolase [Elizabethkingia meningoseptica]
MIKLLYCLLFVSVSVSAQDYSPKNYVFFLHNKFLEDHDINDIHPKYGSAAYEAILQKLQNENTILISEKRLPNTDLKNYTKKVLFKIDSLHNTGVPYDHIAVVGTSKGGYIAQYVSNYAKNSKLKFVFIGASFKNDSMNQDREFQLYGNILSIIERTDTGAVALSKQQRYKNSNLKSFKEINVDTGLEHGFLFKALDEWIEPIIHWLGLNEFHKKT